MKKTRTLEEYSRLFGDTLGQPEKIGMYHYIFTTAPQDNLYIDNVKIKYVISAVCIEAAEEIKSSVKIPGEYKPNSITRKEVFENPELNRKHIKFINKDDGSTQPTYEDLDELLNIDLIGYKNQLKELILKEQEG